MAVGADARSAAGRDPRPLVIGLGHPGRHDDALGLEAIDRLAPRLEGRADARRCSSEGTELLDLWEGRELVVVVDAVRSGSPPGTAFRLEAGERPLAAPFAPSSTHGLSIADVVELGRSLGRLPRRLVVYGIEGERFEPGIGLSPRVAVALERTVGEILGEVLGPEPRAETPREDRHA